MENGYHVILFFTIYYCNCCHQFEQESRLDTSTMRENNLNNELNIEKKERKNLKKKKFVNNRQEMITYQM
jgi:hypothetical protein